MENKILSLIAFDRKAYNEIKDTINEEDFSDYGQIILEELKKFYEVDERSSAVDLSIVAARIERNYPKHFDGLNIVLNGLVPVSVPNVLAEYVDLRLHSLARKIGGYLSAGQLTSEVKELIEEFTFLNEKREAALSPEEDETNISIGISLDELEDDLNPENLISFWPKSLNDELEGGVPRGSHVVLFARPETGKSMFAINLIANMLQEGYKVLYVGNEDPMSTIKKRIISNLSGMDRHEMLADAQEAHDRADNMGVANLITIEAHPGTVSMVRRFVAKFKPDIFIVDQIRNLSTSSMTKVEQYEYIAQSMRAIAKEYNCVGVSITQAGDSADQVLVLGMGDVDFSNTGIPATADLMIGIGVNDSWDELDRRMLSLCKNKVSGSHSTIPVRVVPKLSMITDVQ